ncbi:hypothetical protein WS70_20020 [Burkholderia mayonis]|uniref:Uncharacterized protein n=2 Tax=Burkholderia mayonis TaxID=1385591 RepID=A0A1B4FKG8_9BURK|nr:hypothetical protein WS70_20020 [Burkholderia mayonis]KVE42732.1 hypothetical protein WS70_11315 [Burkholderia mayonis]
MSSFDEGASILSSACSSSTQPTTKRPSAIIRPNAASGEKPVLHRKRIVASNRQGRALGVARPVMAIAWSVTGLLINPLPWLGETGPLFVGGIGFLFSFAMLLAYRQRRAPAGEAL